MTEDADMQPARALTRRTYLELIVAQVVLFAIAPSPCGGFCALVAPATVFYSGFAWVVNLVLALVVSWIPSHRFGMRLAVVVSTLAALVALPILSLASEESSTPRVWLFVFGTCAPVFAFPLFLIWGLVARRRE